MSVKIKDENHTDELLRIFDDLEGRKIEWGIFKEEIAQYASANEYGVKIKVTEKMRAFLHTLDIHLKPTTKVIVIPERSWLRSVADDKKLGDEITDDLSKAYEFDTFSPEKTLNNIGEFLVAKTKKKIGSNIPPANSAATKMIKGSSRTLIGNGLMRRSVDYEVK